MRVPHRGAGAVDLHAGVDEHALVDAVQSGDLAVLVREERRPVEARLAARPAVGGGDLELLAEMRGVGKELLRDAADVDAGAAEAPGLGDRDFRPVRGGHAARAHSARAAAYREKVVIEIQAGGGFTSGSEG